MLWSQLECHVVGGNLVPVVKIVTFYGVSRNATLMRGMWSPSLC